jgi:hypothetical protein
LLTRLVTHDPALTPDALAVGPPDDAALGDGDAPDDGRTTLGALADGDTEDEEDADDADDEDVAPLPLQPARSPASAAAAAPAAA